MGELSGERPYVFRDTAGLRKIDVLGANVQDYDAETLTEIEAFLGRLHEAEPKIYKESAVYVAEEPPRLKGRLAISLTVYGDTSEQHTGGKRLRNILAAGTQVSAMNHEVHFDNRTY